MPHKKCDIINNLTKFPKIKRNNSRFLEIGTT